MLAEERQERLSQLLAHQGMSDLDSLALTLKVSQSTVRRDVETLVDRGLVRRTHGGVVWLGDRNNAVRPYAFDQRLSDQIESKRQIARAAAELVQPGQTILIDGGTTTFYLAQALAGHSLQLVTNSLPIAEVFLNDEKVELILTGGLLYPRYGVLLGPSAESMLASIHAKTLFLSVAGIHNTELYNQNLLLVHAERKMMEQAQQVVLLVDHAKFGQQALVKLGDLGEVDIVVCDSAITPADKTTIAEAGCRLIVAS